jgi:hypothetical protein
LFHAEGQTDVMKVAVAFRNFANAPDIMYEHFLQELQIHKLITKELTTDNNVLNTRRGLYTFP